MRERKLSDSVQKIVVFQQHGSGEHKIAALRTFADTMITLEIISIDENLPDIIDDPYDFIPENLSADLVLDFLKHPDLAYDLAVACRDRSIPVIASGKKSLIREVITPPTWCGLVRRSGLGRYGELFGMPEFAVELEGDTVSGIRVIRAAPCGATGEAASRVLGERAIFAPERIGLEVQFFCTADPAGWDIIHGKSPVHFAGNVHQKALERAIKKIRWAVYPSRTSEFQKKSPQWLV